MSRKFTLVAVAASAALALGACSNSASTTQDSAAASAPAAADNAKPLIVGASPSPHAKILEYIAKNLAEKEGLKLEVKEYQDYIQPNEALAAGDLDANYFQTVPYLEEQSKANPNYKFTAGKGVHLEPLGVYSEKLKNINEIKDGATIGIINDPTNQARGLKLLESAGLIKLPTAGDVNVVTVEKAENNPRGFKFKEVEGPLLVRTLADVDIAIINGNFAQLGGKTPADAIVLESTENNPAANLLVWRTESDNDPRIAKLEALLHSPEVKKYIEETWADKSVIPVF